MRWAGLKRWDKFYRRDVIVMSEVDDKGFHTMIDPVDGLVRAHHEYLLTQTLPAEPRKKK